jgi:hypothetical protein
MFGFSKNNVYLMIGGLILFLLFCGVIKYQQYRIESLNVQVSELELISKTQKLIIEQLKFDITHIQKINIELVKKEREAVIQATKLTQKLNKLNSAATGKPKLVEKLVNNASKERIRCLEIASGAIPQQSEKNTVCPHLVEQK